jgi:hypothetical protein
MNQVRYNQTERKSNLESTINSTFHYEVSKNPEFNPNQSEITSESGIDSSRTTSHTDSVINPSEASTCSTYNESMDARSDDLKSKMGNMPKELMSMFDDIEVGISDFGDFGWSDDEPADKAKKTNQDRTKSSVKTILFEAEMKNMFSTNIKE